MPTPISTQTDYDISDSIRSEYITVDTLRAGPLSVRIKAVTFEHFDARGALPARDLYVLHFDGEPVQRFALGAKTNRKTLAAAFGPKTIGWLNRDIDLVLDTMNGREFVRVMLPPPPAPRRARPLAPAPPVVSPPEPEDVPPADDYGPLDDDTAVL
jgi:hypothetical protein